MYQAIAIFENSSGFLLWKLISSIERGISFNTKTVVKLIKTIVVIENTSSTDIHLLLNPWFFGKFCVRTKWLIPYESKVQIEINYFTNDAISNSVCVCLRVMSMFAILIR